MDWFDAPTRMFSDGLRAVGARYPTLIAVSISLGFISKLSVHILSDVYHSQIVHVLDVYDWYVYAAISNGILLLPSIFGKTRVPDIVLAQIAAVKKIMDEANMSKQNRALFWSNFLGKFIRETTISAELPPPERIKNDQAPGALKHEGAKRD